MDFKCLTLKLIFQCELVETASLVKWTHCFKRDQLISFGHMVAACAVTATVLVFVKIQVQSQYTSTMCVCQQPLGKIVPFKTEVVSIIWHYIVQTTHSHSTKMPSSQHHRKFLLKKISLLLLILEYSEIHFAMGSQVQGKKSNGMTWWKAMFCNFL